MGSPVDLARRTDGFGTYLAKRRNSKRFLTRAWIVCGSTLALFAVSACGGVNGDQPAGEFEPAIVEWQLVFEDNFDGNSLDATKWNVDEGDGCPDVCGWGNNELQIYSADNIDVSGGTLKLEGRREMDGSYTSGRINTRGKLDFTYGKVEVRAKIPSGQGTWPAIWALHSPIGSLNPEYPALGAYGPWPMSGEIDIMEAFNYRVFGDQTKSTTHYGLPVPPFDGTGGFSEKGGMNLAADADLQFYVYGMEWERGRIRFFVDQDSLVDRNGQVVSDGHFQTQTIAEYYTYYPAGADGFYDPFGAFTTGLDNAPFDQAFHLILNFAIGGDPVGAPDMSTVFPQALEIDYVRVYECANSNPDTKRGCGALDPSVTPLEDLDGGPLAGVLTAKPYVESLDLYLDGPEIIAVNFGTDMATNMLEVDGFTGSGATVVSDVAAQDPDDAENTVWNVAISGGVANVFLKSQDLSGDPILDTGFDFSSADPVGEIVFEMYVNSVSPGANILVKLDSGFPNLGEVVLPEAELAIGEWKTYSVKFSDLIANPGFVDCCGGTGVDLSRVVNPFVFEVASGDVDVFLDNIRVTNACYVVGACSAKPITRGLPDIIIFDDAVNTATWDVGIAGASTEDGFAANYFDGTADRKAQWAIIDDPDDVATRGQILNSTYRDDSEFGIMFIGSSAGINLSAYSAGALEFDIYVDDYGNSPGMTFKVDGANSSSGDKNIGRIGDGAWETVQVPASLLTGSGLDLSEVTAVVFFPSQPQTGGISFRIDNMRWVDEADAPPLAQIDLPVTFDDPGVDYSLIDFGGTSTLIVTDPAGGTNQVAQTTHNGGQFAGTVIGLDGGFANPIPFTMTETTMSVRVWSPAAGIPVMLKVEDASDPNIFAEVIATTTVANAWETLVYDYVGVIDPANITYEKAVIFFNFPNAGDGSIYYWDDVQFGLGGPMPLDLPITFEDANLDYELADFGGAGTSLVSDPVNMMNTVASTNKPPGAETFAGTVVGATNGLANPIPFAAANTSLSMRVYSPDAGIPVRMKVENAANGAISVETETLTTVANDWETVTFDFANEVAGTPALDLGQAYEKVVVFFNFGTDGTTAGDKTYLWDDIQFVTGGTLAQVDLPITFDEVGVDFDIVAFGNATAMAPVADPVDPANLVATLNKPPGAELWSGATMGATNGLATPIPFTATETKMSVRVYSPDAGIPVRLKVENAANNAVSVETEATTTMANAWETLTFDFANEVAGTPALDPAQSYEKVVIFFNFGTDGNTAGDKTYYWEDVEFGVPLDLPVTFDDPDISYQFIDFGGAATSVAADPAGGMNMVAATVKGPPETFAGTIVGDGSGFANPIPLTATETTMTLRVYSPTAGIPVRLKVENAANGAISVETEALTTVANDWETLTFDFANEVAGTPVFDPAQSYEKAVVFFNFGTVGTGLTYYWDDLQFGVTP